MIDVLAGVSTWAVPFLLAFIPIYGALRGVPVYEAFVEGAEEGARLCLRLTPYLLTILVGLGVFRDTGAMSLLARLLDPLLRPLGLPAEVIPLVIARPLSGSGALGITAELIRSHGPDSAVGRLASIMQGSTDTTFYVLSVYFGSVGVRQARWAVWSGLVGDAVAFVASAIAWRLFF